MEHPALDTLRRVETPEGCELTLRLAGPVARARAFFFDLLVRGAVFIVATLALGYFGKLGWGLAAVVYFALGWLYPVGFEVLNGGATPGKRWCRLAVLRDDGTPAGWDAAFVRNTLRFVDGFPVGYAAGLLAMAFNRDSKRLGDILAGTVVVHQQPAAAMERSTEEGAEPSPFPLLSSEQRALLEYWHRAGMLTPERAEELAQLAEPLTGGLPPHAGRARLLRIANGILGSRSIRGPRCSS